jgi:hypothetical protein
MRELRDGWYRFRALAFEGGGRGKMGDGGRIVVPSVAFVRWHIHGCLMAGVWSTFGAVAAAVLKAPADPVEQEENCHSR